MEVHIELLKHNLDLEISPEHIRGLIEGKYAQLSCDEVTKYFTLENYLIDLGYVFNIDYSHDNFEEWKEHIKSRLN